MNVHFSMDTQSSECSVTYPSHFLGTYFLKWGNSLKSRLRGGMQGSYLLGLRVFVTIVGTYSEIANLLTWLN